MERTLKFHIFETLDSTQIKAKTLLKDPSKLHVIMAFHQTQGQGTRGKSWVSPENSGLYVTFAFELDNLDSMASLSHLATCAAILSLEPLNPQLKWPNDIMIHGAKIGGVLTEIVGHQVYTGIGINLKRTEQLKTIDQPTTSYDQHQAPPDPIALCHILADHYLKLLNDWEKSGFKSIKKIYIDHFDLMNKDVVVDTPKGLIRGALVDFSDEGYPILQLTKELLTLEGAQHIQRYS
jgi:BirA family biotin operon repressor/biotin-[acetyl-CoA-carboxylase] ligase